MRYVMAAIAVLTCPCHLPIVLLAIAGTGLGAVLQDNLGLAVIAFTVLFVGSGWTALRLFSRANPGDHRSRGRR